MDSAKVLELTVSGIVTLFAAFFGALFAYFFNLAQQKSALRKLQIEECNRAMLALFQQFNSLSNYRDQTLEKFRTSAGRHLQVRGSTPFAVDHATVNVSALAFLIQTMARDVPADAAMLQTKYRSCLDLINQRSAVHINEYQPALERAMQDAGNIDVVPGSYAEEAVGRRITVTLKTATDAIYDQVYGTLDEYAKAGTEMRDKLKAAFPDGKIIGFTPIKKDDSTA